MTTFDAHLLGELVVQSKVQTSALNALTCQVSELAAQAAETNRLLAQVGRDAREHARQAAADRVAQVPAEVPRLRVVGGSA